MKKLIIIMYILFPLINFGQANKLIRKGLKAEDLNEKIQYFSEAIALEPKNLDAYFYRGLAKNDIGDCHGAIMDYTKVVFYEPSADVYFNRGNSKYALMDYEGAKEDYINALKLNSEFTEARYSLAVTKNDLKDYDSAIADLGILSVYNAPEVFLQLGRAYLGLKNYPIALKHYNAAVLINPDTKTLYARGLFFMDINYFKNAFDDFNAVIYLNKDYVPAYFFRGISSFLLGDFDRSLSDFKTSIQYDITDFDALIGLAFSYNKLNDLPNAKLNLQKAKSILQAKNMNQENDIKLFKNTYWYQKQYYKFIENYKELNDQ
ncbi:tetratricopeptide repeat protein [Yeosuana sp.]|uniref:tetratricopeptide repeat protein n=1 Tax=Yeosuana sp. TaxID=2529388 RepID=UPI004054BAD2